MPRNIPLAYRFAGWFMAVRVHYIVLLVCAQYLAAGYIFSDKGLTNSLLDTHLFLLVFATVCAIAAGYILDDYFDIKRDIINYPLRTQIVNMASSRSKKMGYIFLNITALTASLMVSWRSGIFFISYIIGLWIYSFFLKRLVLVGNLVCVSLMMTPFFILDLYYRDLNLSIIAHAAFLFLLLFLHLSIKDIRNISGDYTLRHYTVANVYGENTSKQLIKLIMILLIIFAIATSLWLDVGLMSFYFYFCALLLVALLFLSFITKKYLSSYRLLHYVVKFVIVLGVFSIIFYNK